MSARAEEVAAAELLLAMMQNIKDACIQSVEKRVADECIDAVRIVFGVTS